MEATRAAELVRARRRAVPRAAQAAPGQQESRTPWAAPPTARPLRSLRRPSFTLEVYTSARISSACACRLRLGKSRGVRVMQVEDARELAEEAFGEEQCVGVTAGTSVLPETIEQVVAKLRGFHAASVGC